MGYFSYLTADTKETVPNIYSRHPYKDRSVYILQPEGKEPIETKGNDGHGRFGSINILDWITHANLDNLNDNLLDFLQKKAKSKKYRDELLGEVVQSTKEMDIRDLNYLLFMEESKTLGENLQENKKLAFYDKETKTLIVEPGEGDDDLDKEMKKLAIEYASKKYEVNNIARPREFDSKIKAIGNISYNDILEGKDDRFTSITAREVCLKDPSKFKPLKLSYNKDAIYENLDESKRDPSQGFFYSEKEILKAKEKMDKIKESVSIPINKNKKDNSVDNDR